MRRILLLLAMMALTLVVTSGVALAVVKVGGPGHDTLIGTKGPDTLAGRGGIDEINGRGGEDVISGGPGNDFLVDGSTFEAAVDTLSGGGGDDTIVTFNSPAAPDIISCGAGSHDVAEVDRKDIVGVDCERVVPI